MMELSEFVAFHGNKAKLVRDGQFKSLGFISYNFPQLLVFIENDEYLAGASSNPQITCAITTDEIAQKLPTIRGIAVVDNPRKAFYKFHNHLARNTNFYKEPFETEISPRALIDPSACVATKNVKIGRDVIIESHVKIYENVIIGDETIIRAGATIGADGFEFKRFDDEILHVVHAGGVRIGERVEIQCNSNVDLAVFGGFTEIGDDTKIDTLVHVGHQSIVGKRCMVAASTVLCGSCKLEDDVWIGPHSTISSEVIVKKGAYVTLGSVVTRNVESGQRVTGNFAIDHAKFIEFIKTIR
jgi:UDP-3-O-[3-hydroxymyristoyl] glucosamine N-acyltransferase